MEIKNKILIVEDDALIGADIKSSLEEFGYLTFGPFAYGEDVLQNIDQINPDFILMDIGLAGSMDGIETAKAIQAKANIPVVFLSALNDEATLQRAKLKNTFGYLIKPFNAQELHSTIQLTLHRISTLKESPEAQDSRVTSVFDLDSISAEGAQTFDFLSSHPVFEGIPEELVKRVSVMSAVKEFDGGSYITMEGELLNGGFIPLSGRISVTKSSESGKELIVALLAPGDPFGLFYLLDSFDGTSAARAQIDSKILWIPKSEWNDLCKKAPLIYQNISQALIERLVTAHTLSSSIAHARVESRIAHTLLYLLPDFGKSYTKQSSDGRIFITRKELAELTGTTPETAIRVTKQLEREEILDLAKPGIIKIPNIENLKAIIGR